MNIGVCGYGSREKPLKSLPKPKGMRGSNEPILPLPLAIIPGDFSADEAPGSSDSLSRYKMEGFLLIKQYKHIDFLNFLSYLVSLLFNI